MANSNHHKGLAMTTLNSAADLNSPRIEQENTDDAVSEETLLQACLHTPDDMAPRLQYAEWLRERRDPRAELLFFADEVRRLPSAVVQQSDAWGRLLRIRRKLNSAWSAIFCEFDCRVHEVEPVRICFSTYGNAPKQYGPKAYKVTPVARVFLVLAGWEFRGHGRGYDYVRPPEGQMGRNPVITTYAPTEREVLRIGASWHAHRKSKTAFWGPWVLRYRARGWLRVTVSTGGFMDGPILRAAEEQVLPPCPATFEFGTSDSWSSCLTWRQGDDNPPHVHRTGKSVT